MLDLDLVPIEKAQLAEGEASSWWTVSRTPAGTTSTRNVPLYAVIDHHDTPGDLEGVPFVDVRRSLGATCSLVTSYLMEQNIAVPPDLATGLLYGIETELSGYPREASPLDDGALLYLYPLADKDLLARIRNARLPQSHFECILQALQNSFIYDRLIISWANELPQPELAAEVADFLIRFEEIDWAVCAGVCEDKLILSARAAVPRRTGGRDAQAGGGQAGPGGRPRPPGRRHDCAAEHLGQRRGAGAGRAASPAAQGPAHRRVPRPAPGVAERDFAELQG